MPSDLVLRWYGLLGTFNQLLNEPIRDLAAWAGIPPLTAVLLGLLGALSPCQLTTGAGAVALIGRRLERGAIAAGFVHVAGKAVAYSVLGVLFVLLGQAMGQTSIPVFQAVRRASGPLMLVAGLVLIGILRSRFSFGAGERIAAAAGARLDASRPQGAFLLGIAFGLVFCPTLFLLFFVLLIPLALGSPGGVIYPALFAVGSALPVLLLLTLIGLGVGAAAPAVGLIGRARPLITQLAGLVLILTGVHDTVIYWFL